MIWGVSTAVFAMLRLTGNPAALLIDPNATREQYEALLRFYGLDQPLHIQYFRFLGQLLRGELGNSFLYRQPALRIVLERVPATIQLTVAALLIAVVTAVPLGILAAVHHNSLLDYGVSFVAVIGQSMPNYWLGIMLILLFAVQLHLLPTSGRGGLRYLILPAVTLASAPAAKYLRLTRSEMLEILQANYIRTARAKGLAERTVLLMHALKNAAIALVTIMGMDLGYLLGGAVVTETVFAWPGIGRLVVDSVLHRDYPVVQADVIFIAVVVVGVNLVVDLFYAVLDPRVRLTST